MTEMMTFNNISFVASLLTLKSANCIHQNFLWNEWSSSQFDPLHVYQHHVKLMENRKYISLTGYNSMQCMAICFLLS